MKQIVSLYCGPGGIDEGLRQAGFKTTIAIDYDKDSCKTLKKNHPDCEVINGKVGDLKESLPKKPFAIVGGPPCPEFSRANIGRTFDLCEINNFWGIIEQLKPQYYLMENVQDVKKKLWKQSFLVNCADYAVPQIRLRRFFTNIPLPSPTHAESIQTNLFGHNLSKWITVGEALHITKLEPTEKYHSWLRDKNPIMYEKHQPNFLDRPATTINTRDRANPTDYITDGYYCRKLTNEELAILQGFPLEYVFIGTKTSIRKQIGNAVPPPAIKAFFNQLN